MAGVLKDSKTRWLGQIPTDWDMVRVKDCFDRKNKKANQKNPIVLSLARSGVKIRDITSNEGQLAADYTNYNPVAKDDILINPMDLVSGDNCNISKVEGVISPAYVNLRYKKGINPRFYNYYFKLQYWLGAFFAHGYGVSFDNRWTLSYEALSKYPIVLPPSEEQDKIADFLDEKCAEIDKLSEDIQKQIDILNNYKKSVITRAVTKGLDPNAEMKDSGIKWIGDIPKNWTSKKVKYYLFRDEKRNPGEMPILSVYREYGVIPKNSRDDNHNVTSEDTSKYKYVRPGYLVINKMKAWQGSMGVSDYEGVVSPAYFIYRLKSKDILPEYIHHLLRSCYKDEFRRISGGIREGQWDLPAIGFENTPICIPSIDEQKSILNFIDSIVPQIEESVSVKAEQILRLLEYKKSIIYEYVTGKKRVKGAL